MSSVLLCLEFFVLFVLLLVFLLCFIAVGRFSCLQGGWAWLPAGWWLARLRIFDSLLSANVQKGRHFDAGLLAIAGNCWYCCFSSVFTTCVQFSYFLCSVFQETLPARKTLLQPGSQPPMPPCSYASPFCVFGTHPVLCVTNECHLKNSLHLQLASGSAP